MTSSDLERVDRAYRRLGRRWAWNALAFAGFQGWESTIRRRAVTRLELQPGATVLDVACGRGSNFPYLQRVIGDGGRVVGVDYSATMLAGAQALAKERQWANVGLVRADASQMHFKTQFDGAICTIAMSVIPRWRESIRAMVEAVRPGGRVAVVDGRLGTGLRRFGNPYARFFASITAAELGRDIPGECRALLVDAHEESVFIGTYYIVSGRVPS